MSDYPLRRPLKMLRKPLEEAPVQAPDADLGHSVIKVTRKLKKMPTPDLLPSVAIPVQGEEGSSSDEEDAPLEAAESRMKSGLKKAIMENPDFKRRVLEAMGGGERKKKAPVKSLGTQVANKEELVAFSQRLFDTGKISSEMLEGVKNSNLDFSRPVHIKMGRKNLNVTGFTI
jgi:hypothetical protein